MKHNNCNQRESVKVPRLPGTHLFTTPACLESSPSAQTQVCDEVIFLSANVSPVYHHPLHFSDLRDRGRVV